MTPAFRAQVPASTANLGPGFDTLGLALDLHNFVALRESGTGRLEMRIAGEADTSLVARDEHNLVFRAARRVFELAGRVFPPVALDLEINAPLARGLGSSASAIVGGMAVANAWLGHPLDADTLLAEMVAMEGHPDNVVACARGGLVACANCNGRVIFEQYHPADSLRFVLLIPDYELPTAKARMVIPKSVPFRDAVFNVSRVALVVERLRSGRIQDLALVMDDRLHQPYRRELVRHYDIIVAEAERAGAGAVALSGAGPTMLAVCEENRAADVAATMASVLTSTGTGCKTMVVRADVKGCVLTQAN